jgi:hypothetical protein
MKNNLLIVLVLVAATPVRAQKVIEKHMDLSANGIVSMNFQISDSIRIITWKKNEVYVKSTIDVNDNKNNDDYKETFNESGNTVNVIAKLEYHCHTFHSRRKSSDSSNRSSDSNRLSDSNRSTDSNRSSDSNNDCCCNCGCETNIYHVIYVPENTDFSVETINGNITISGNTAKIRAHSISGYIDLSMSPERPADLSMRTISGAMYSNFELSGNSRHDRQVGGGTVHAQLNGSGGKAIELETISGDIFFRKQG